MNESDAYLAQVLGDLAITMQDETDTEATLEAIVRSAVGIVPGARWAGITIIEGRSVESRVPTADLVSDLDETQNVLNDGPCLTSLRDHHTVHVDDMEAESRWPGFCRAAVTKGVRSSLSFQLFVRRENLGALNLYGGEAGAFDDDSFLIGEVLAQHASVALVGAAAESQFQRAVSSRDVIGQAKGILMHRQGITGMKAFRALTQASQETNMKLVDVARWVVQDHESGLDRSGDS